MEEITLAAYAFIVAANAVLVLTASALLGRRKRGTVKEDPVECGVPSLSETRTEFNVRVFMVALLFVLFDIEVVLLAPYALRYTGLGLEGLVVAGIFLAVLTLALVYEWRKGVLDWNVPLGVDPADMIRRQIREAERQADEAGAEPQGHGAHH
jgi:NADH-quinone oxidoreductase subunit A